MSCYNGFEVYVPNKEGVFENISGQYDAYTCGRYEANRIWNDNWYTDGEGKEHCYTFTKSFDKHTNRALTGSGDVIYDYKSIDDFEKEAQPLFDEYTNEHMEGRRKLLARIAELTADIADYKDRQLKINTTDEKLFKLFFDTFEDKIDEARDTIAELKDALMSYDDDDDNFRKMREYKDLIAEVRKAFKEHPDAVIVQFCEN